LKTISLIIFFLIFLRCSADAQVDNWSGIIKNTQISAKYFSPLKSESFKSLAAVDSRQKEFAFIKHFSDENINVKLTFNKYDSHLELSGEVENKIKGDMCLTLKVIFPSAGFENIVWSYDLDSIEAAGSPGKLFSNYVDASTTIPPAGAFNVDKNHDGGYGDKVGTGLMSFFPLASITAGNIGLGWGVDMSIPLVFRLAYEPGYGMISEFDFGISDETKKFPGRAFFKILLFEFNPEWNMRAALDKYYKIQPEYFKKRVPQEGIWLPFAPLFKIDKWEDFGFAFHELHYGTIDGGISPPLSSIEAGKKAGVLTFQYTEPWEEEIPIKRLDLTYEQVAGKETITEEHSEYMKTNAALDKEGKLIARKLETPCFESGWAASINANMDPDIKGFNRYDYVAKEEMYPAIERNIDGIYFDCIEWHWHYDMNYNRAHFEYADFPLTFSSSLNKPRPVIWHYSSEYEFMSRVADEMHRKGKYVMGNTFYWIPFAAGVLDLFGSELSWYINVDTRMNRLQFLRAMAYQKPAVFLLNEGMDNEVFIKPPYEGYKIYFEKMLFYGFFPSFFSINAVDDIYWSDSTMYNSGRPYFKKYIPLIKEISAAGWEPVSYAAADKPELKLERFGNEKNIYFTIYNPYDYDIQTTLKIDAGNLLIKKVLNTEELINKEKPAYHWKENFIEIEQTIKRKSAHLIKITTQ